MKPIWYFVGLLLLIMGAIITMSGIYDVLNPPAQQKVLGNTFPALWWGLIMTAGGVVFLLANRKKTVR